MKLFRNTWDYYHFFGPMALGVAWSIIAILNKQNMNILYIYVSMSIVLLFLYALPILWEYWDLYKIPYGSPMTSGWSWFKTSLFTSDGKFDWHDAWLGYAGMTIGIVGVFIINEIM
jgi:hypothetical protein